jgi:hypothetical protein
MRTHSAIHHENDDALSGLNPNSTSSCGFKMYPYPESSSRLPWLFDVFASHDSEFVIFVAMHRGFIDPQYQQSDNFAANVTTGLQHRFLCYFQGEDGIISEPVHRVGFGDLGGNEQEWTYLIHCRIPKKHRSLINVGQTETQLHVDLYAAHSVDAGISVSLDSFLPPSHNASKLSNIAVCHPSTLQPNQFRLMAHTRIKSAYSYQANGKPIFESYRIHDWIEYHKFRGVDHFIIYDNDPIDHGPLESTLKPYIDSGLVTRMWNPMNESYRVLQKGRQTCHIQGATGVAALLRFGFATEYFANMDIDEFFIPGTFVCYRNDLCLLGRV